jgi:hypothetical protein
MHSGSWLSTREFVLFLAVVGIPLLVFAALLLYVAIARD